jgi:hypothetical protein
MAKKRKTAAAKKDREVVIVASKVKHYINGKKMYASSECIASLSDKVYSMLDQAVCRTKANNRKTVTKRDI